MHWTNILFTNAILNCNFFVLKNAMTVLFTYISLLNQAIQISIISLDYWYSYYVKTTNHEVEYFVQLILQTWSGNFIDTELSNNSHKMRTVQNISSVILIINHQHIYIFLKYHAEIIISRTRTKCVYSVLAL